MNKTLSCGLALALAAMALPLHAQSNDEGLANLVPNLILNGITLPGADNPGRPHAGHFTLGNPTFGGSQPASQVDVPSMQGWRRSTIACGRSWRISRSARRPAASR